VRRSGPGAGPVGVTSPDRPGVLSRASGFLGADELDNFRRTRPKGAMLIRATDVDPRGRRVMLG